MAGTRDQSSSAAISPVSDHPWSSGGGEAAMDAMARIRASMQVEVRRLANSPRMSDRIEAAGGVVTGDDGRVLLVHRPRYDDWTLPKGKLDAGESFEDAALREVEEETGLRCRFIRAL